MTSSYSIPETRIEDFFRIKSAGSSNYRGACFGVYPRCVPTCLSAGGRGWFKIGKNSVKNQSKALIPQNKNENFQKFLTYFPKTSYERRATGNGYIFVSNVQRRLIIEALLFSPPAKSSQILRAYGELPITTIENLGAQRRPRTN